MNWRELEFVQERITTSIRSSFILWSEKKWEHFFNYKCNIRYICVLVITSIRVYLLVSRQNSWTRRKTITRKTTFFKLLTELLVSFRYVFHFLYQWKTVTKACTGIEIYSHFYHLSVHVVIMISYKTAYSQVANYNPNHGLPNPE